MVVATPLPLTALWGKRLGVHNEPEVLNAVITAALWSSSALPSPAQKREKKRVCVQEKPALPSAPLFAILFSLRPTNERVGLLLSFQNLSIELLNILVHLTLLLKRHFP
jgi:hypothetical protein